MRAGTLLGIGIGLLLVGACNGPTPDVEACIQQQGVCVSSADMAECAALISGSGLCSSNYVCCTPIGSPYDAGGGIDSGVDATGVSKDSGKDAAKDTGTTTDSGKADAANDGSKSATDGTVGDGASKG